MTLSAPLTRTVSEAKRAHASPRPPCGLPRELPRSCRWCGHRKCFPGLLRRGRPKDEARPHNAGDGPDKPECAAYEQVAEVGQSHQEPNDTVGRRLQHHGTSTCLPRVRERVAGPVTAVTTEAASTISAT